MEQIQFFSIKSLCALSLSITLSACGGGGGGGDNKPPVGGTASSKGALSSAKSSIQTSIPNTSSTPTVASSSLAAQSSIPSGEGNMPSSASSSAISIASSQANEQSSSSVATSSAGAIASSEAASSSEMSSSSEESSASESSSSSEESSSSESSSSSEESSSSESSSSSEESSSSESSSSSEESSSSESSSSSEESSSSESSSSSEESSSSESSSSSEESSSSESSSSSEESSSSESSSSSEESSSSESSSSSEESSSSESSSSSSAPASPYHVRGTHNAWAEGLLMTRIGTTDMYESCVNFVAGDTNGGPRFKIDPDGGWEDGIPAQDFAVTSGWVKIYFDSITKTITTQQNLPANCVTPMANYHLRGTFNGWAEGTVMTRIGSSEIYESCQEFAAGDANGGPRFKIDLNGGWGNDSIPNTDFSVAAGWVKVTYDSLAKVITVEENQAVTCGAINPGSSSSSMSSSSSSVSSSSSSVSSSSSSSSSSVVSGTTFHLRGTQNNWAEGDLFTPVSGSTTNLEICRNFTTGDATGGPRFKVDPNGAWGTDAFPAADVAASGWTKIVINGTTRTIVSTTTGLGTNCGAAPMGDDFRARTIYFMFVDRFHNGNTANDNGTNPAATSTVKGAGNQGEWKKYWGGDIEGIIAKLDYLQALGVTAIWVTPFMDNINVGNEGGYHGYWVRDFYEVDEHLGSWALVDELDAQMEARGMKLVLDITLNHSNQDDQYEFGALYKEGAFITDANSGAGTWYHDNGAIADCGDTNPETKCDAEWDDPWSFRNKSLYNLTDFLQGTTSNSLADQYLINAALKWMDHGVDAFRIDAIKHIEPSFINRFSAAVRAKKADTYIFGEWYSAGAGEAASMAFLNERRGSELLDFKLRDNIENAIAGNSTMITLSNHIKSRPAAMNNFEDLQTIFLDNHDATRTSVYLQTTARTNRGNGKGMTKAFADARQNLGMALVMTLPGIPTIYYGTEQNATWFTANVDGEMGHDPYNREAMPSFSTTTPAFDIISKLSAVRKASPAIQRGVYEERWATADVLVFQRREGSDCAVVAVNRGAATTVTVPNLCLANGAYTSKVGSDVVNVTGGSGSFNLSQNEVIALH